MGLDWNPANKPIPGRETEYEELAAALQAEAEQSDDETEEESEISKRFFECSISAFDTLAAPTVGEDKAADEWAKEVYESENRDEPFEIWFENVRGLRLVHLVPECAGVPKYSNGSPAGYVEPFSFRGQFLTLCEDIIGEDVLEQCYENKTPEELVEFGKLLKKAGLDFASKHGVLLPPTTDEFDENAPEWKADILVSAGEWCIFWGERGHPLDAYW